MVGEVLGGSGRDGFGGLARRRPADLEVVLLLRGVERLILSALKGLLLLQLRNASYSRALANLLEL